MSAEEAQHADQFKPVNRRAGYSQQLQWALKQARKGGTLAAGEGLLIVEHYEGLIADLNATIDEALSDGWQPRHWAKEMA